MHYNLQRSLARISSRRANLAGGWKPYRRQGPIRVSLKCVA
jgi:hypothetical protein